MYPDAWIRYLYEFHVTRDYFECHEQLEEFWKATAMSDPLLAAFIQVAVGQYHLRRGNKRGARKMWEGALDCFQTRETTRFGIDIVRLTADLHRWIAQLEAEHLYSDPVLPFTDVELRNQIVALAEKKVAHLATLQICLIWN